MKQPKNLLCSLLTLRRRKQCPNHINQRYHKQGNYRNEEGLAQLGGSLQQTVEDSPSANIARATMEVLKSGHERRRGGRASQEFLQFDLMPVADGVQVHKSTRSLSNQRRRMSAAPQGSRSQAVLGGTITPTRSRSRGAYEQIFDSNQPALGRTTYTGYWRS